MQAKSLTYSVSLKANLRLVVYDIDTENNTKQILSAKEQEVFIGELPLMTQRYFCCKRGRESSSQSNA